MIAQRRLFRGNVFEHAQVIVKSATARTCDAPVQAVSLFTTCVGRRPVGGRFGLVDVFEIGI